MEKTCMECRHKIRPEKDKKMLINRLKRIEGQVRGIQGMIESDAYCVDILIQVQAVRAALNGLGQQLLNTHIATCVAEGIRKGNDEVIGELTDVLYKLMK